MRTSAVLKFFLGPFADFVYSCLRCVLFVFRFEKYYGSFDVSGQESADNDNADMRLMTHDPSSL